MSASAATRPAQAHLTRARGVWTALIISTVLFCTVCSASGILGYIYLTSVRQTEHATLQVIRGSQLVVMRHGRVDAEAVASTTVLNEGDQVWTGSDTEANLDLFDGSTLHLFFDSKASLPTLRSSRFFGNRKEITVSADGGTAVLSTAPTDPGATTVYKITTPQAEIDVDPDTTVRTQVSSANQDGGTRVTVSSGNATVISAGQQVELGANNMSTVAQGEPPTAAVPSEQELIRNGDFTEPPTSRAETVESGGLGTAAWYSIHDRLGETVGAGTVSTDTETVFGHNVVSAVLRGTETNGRYSRLGLRQDINAPASFLHNIELDATVKVVAQTEPVGGPQGDVFPLTIKVLYTDPNGKEQEWKRSIYHCPGDPAQCNLENATDVPLGKYTTQHFVLKNLDNTTGGPGAGGNVGQDISIINSIEITGLGDKFESWLTEISMTAH